MTNLIQTCRQQGKAFLDVAVRLLRIPELVALTLADETEPGHRAAQPAGP